MENFYVLRDAITYIEDHLCEEIRPEEVASFCHYSVSNLKYLFRRVFQYGMMDYVNRRRVTEAAGVLLKTDKKVCEVAFGCGYHSQEAFGRAFKKIWGETPACYRKNHRFYGLFPRQEFFCDESGVFRRWFDLSMLLLELQRGGERAAVCFDLLHFRRIKTCYGREGGEFVILQVIWRLEAALKEGEQVYRMAGDKFVVLLGPKDNAGQERRVRELIREVLNKNGETVSFKGNEVYLYLFAGWTILCGEEKEKGQLFRHLDSSLEEARRNIKVRFLKDPASAKMSGWRQLQYNSVQRRCWGQVTGCRPMTVDGLTGWGTEAGTERRECTFMPPGLETEHFSWTEEEPGYRIFFPDTEDWCRRTLFKEDGSVLREHLHLIEDKYLEAGGTLTYWDCWLECVKMKNGASVLLNEGELKEALHEGYINRKKYKELYRRAISLKSS